MSEKPEGFFKNFHDTINSAIDDVTKLTKNNFANLENNGKRVLYICSLPALKGYDLSKDLAKCKTGGEFPVKKDLKKAKELKDEGNNAVLKGDWARALQLYSQSMTFMPQKETEELSIVLANRSAASNHLEKYKDSLADIQRCLKLGYPRHLQYKVYERKARCLLVLQRNQEAIKAFQDTISALDEAKNLEKEKKSKMHTDAKLLLEILNTSMALAGSPNDPVPLKNTPVKPKLPGKHNPQYPAASEAIQIKYNEAKGRYAMATRDIEAGEILLVERPHSGVLLGEFVHTHCQHCFVNCSIPLACPKCPNVIFCSDKCLEAAQKSYHAYECHILPLIWKSGCSITCHMALRIITQHPKEYFTNLASKLETKPNRTYKTEDYKNIYHLVAHEDKRTKQDFLHRSEMAAFLLKLLEISGYFKGQARDKLVTIEEIKSMAIDEKNKDDIELFGGLILRNMQVLQCNAHEIFEILCPKPKVGKTVMKHEGKSIFLAGAVFPTLALINHSCDPNVVRYFCGPQVIVRAVQNIKKGDEVSETYGPLFTTVPKEKRQAELKDQYWFDCKCIPCEQNWPLYSNMNENYIRFKCDSDRPCPNVLAVPYDHDAQEFMVQCLLCHQHTNIMKGLKALQDAEMMYRLGKAAMEEGNYSEAIRTLAGVLKLYDTYLAPPYHSYYECAQDLRESMLALGNYSIAWM